MCGISGMFGVTGALPPHAASTVRAMNQAIAHRGPDGDGFYAHERAVLGQRRLAIIDVLSRAVEKGGSTLRDFSSADGKTGYFQLEAHVYGRAGEPCRQCGGTIRHLMQGQRATYYCSTCQKP